MAKNKLSPLGIRKAGMTAQIEKQDQREQALAALALMKAREAKLVKKKKLKKEVIGGSEVRGTGAFFEDTVAKIKSERKK